MAPAHHVCMAVLTAQTHSPVASASLGFSTKHSAFLNAHLVSSNFSSIQPSYVYSAVLHVWHAKCHPAYAPVVYPHCTCICRHVSHHACQAPIQPLTLTNVWHAVNPARLAPTPTPVRLASMDTFSTFSRAGSNVSKDPSVPIATI